MRTLVSIQRWLGCVGFDSGAVGLGNERFEIVHTEGWVRFTGRVEIGFDADVQLHSTGFEPCTATPGELSGLGNLGKTQYTDEEGAGFFLFADWHRELDMVNGENGHVDSLRSGFGGVSGVDPGCVAAENGGDVGVSVLEHKERRTGARVFVLSGAVGDDPLVFGEVEVGGVGFDLTQRNVDRAFDVPGLIGSDAAHIQDNGCAGSPGGVGLFERHARHTSFVTRQVGSGNREGGLNDDGEVGCERCLGGGNCGRLGGGCRPAAGGKEAEQEKGGKDAAQGCIL